MKMKMLSWILLLAISIVLISLVSKQANASHYIFNTSYPSTGEWINISVDKPDENCVNNTNGLHCRVTNGFAKIVRDVNPPLLNLSTNTNNFTLRFNNFRTVAGGNSEYIGFAKYDNTSGDVGGAGSSFAILSLLNVNSQKIVSGVYTLDNSNVIAGTHNNTWDLKFLLNNSVDWFINETVYVGNLKIDEADANTRKLNATYFTFSTEQLSTNEFIVGGIMLFNGTNISKNIHTPLQIINSSPSIIINTPINNSRTHNATLFINFTITNADNDNVTYDIFLDTNLNPTTRINGSNITQGNFTFSSYTIAIQNEGSINGTYYLKINATDNSSNVFTIFHAFNLTNSLNLYNATNITLTPLPASVGNQLKAHYNLTNKQSLAISPNQSDNITSFHIEWFINRTLYSPAGNNTLLNAQNVTNNANISSRVRINNGFGETSWTEWVNSSQITVGDSTNPILDNCTIEFTSLTDASGNTNRFNCTARDESSLVSSMSFDLNGTLNTTRNFVFASDTTIIATYIIFESLETLKVGSYSIVNVTVTDSSGNKLINSTNFHFQVTSAPSGGGGSSPEAGGGGGGTTTIIIKGANTTFNLLTENLGEEYESITVSSNTIKNVKILLENKGNKTTIVKLKCIESSNISSVTNLCNNVEFQQESFNIIPSTIPLETQIKVRIPEAELFQSFSLIIEGTSPEGGVDDLRMTFIVFPKFTDAFKIIKQITIGITRFNIGDVSIPFPNIVSFLVMEGIILILFVRRQFTGKWIVIGLLTLIFLIITTTLSFEVCKLSFAECLNIG